MGVYGTVSLRQALMKGDCSRAWEALEGKEGIFNGGMDTAAFYKRKGRLLLVAIDVAIGHFGQFCRAVAKHIGSLTIAAIVF